MRTTKTVLEEINVLEAEKKQLSIKRAARIRQYDNAPDGSRYKIEATIAMDELGDLIRGIERQLSDLVDGLEGRDVC